LLAGLNIWACWRLARPDPSAAADEEGSLRRGVMLASVALAGIAAYQWPGRPATPIFRVAPFVVQMAALAVNDALALVLVKRLTRRSGDALLHRAAKGVLWAFPSIQVVYLLLSLTPMGPYFEVLIYGVSIFNCLAQATMLATIFMLGWTFQAVRGLAAGARERRQAVAAQGAA
jgi:hypothetical protein